MMNITDFLVYEETLETIPTEWLWERIRNWRTAELVASDWTQIADSTANKTAWATYRQALRDLPASNTDPKKIKFPSRPS
jgi:hypothetical protein